MQPRSFTYEELTPLEQCIADYAARQQTREGKRESKRKRPKPRMAVETTPHYHA